MIEIFDCITHPTLNSNWLASKYDGKAGFDTLIKNMQEANIKKAFAIGMKNIGDYDENLFIEKVKKYKNVLYPIAYFDNYKFQDSAELCAYLQEIKQKGFYGIKIHPRFSSINFSNKKLIEVIITANKVRLIPFICTYFSSQSLNTRNNLIEIAQMMNKIPNAQIIFLHSGTVNLLEFVNMMKIYKNVLFDLSYTLCKYNGSSLDMDIQFLFNNFDKRICVGSDHPEVTLHELRERFDKFAKAIPKEKAENIGYKNLEKIIIDCEEQNNGFNR